jgi:hypothetical protein
MNHPKILSSGTANPSVSLTQEQSFHAAGYQVSAFGKFFLNENIGSLSHDYFCASTDRSGNIRHNP